MRYALTGATGFLGGVLARRLREAGHDVVALVRDPAKAVALTALGVKQVAGDLSDPVALRHLCDGADGFFHVAGWYKLGDRHPGEAWRVNVGGTRAALTAAQQTGVPRVVYTSTLAVNSDTRGEVVDETFRFTGRHLSVYDETKAAAHDLAHAMAGAGVPVVTVMPGLIYGPGDTSQTGELIRRVVDGRRPTVPSGGGACWAHVEDVADGHLLAMEHGEVGEDYMLAGPRLALAQGLVQVATLADTEGPVCLPNAAVSLSAIVAGWVGRAVPLPPGYAAETMLASLATYYGTPAKAQAAFDWTCRDPDDGLSEVVQSLRA